jgi:Zn-finger nucleic acid-binding protein
MKTNIPYLFIIFILAISILIKPVLADTGTYVIESQRTDLTVQTNRDVYIEYNVKFRVTGGNIPYVTIGLPTSDFEVINYGGSAISASPKNSYGWSGVYIELDKTYFSGDSFTFNFKVNQKNFVNKYGENASIQFTPTWWDNAQTEKLTIAVWMPPEIKDVKTDSEPTRYENNSVVWEWDNVGRGVKKTVGVIMPLNVFTNMENAQSNSGLGVPSSPISQNLGYFSILSALPFIFIAMFIVFFLFKVLGSGGDYESPSFHIGGNSNFTRHLSMNCINDDEKLEKKDVKEVTIDICNKCGGGFFDKGEIEKLIKNDASESMFTTGKPTGEPKPYRRGVCPRCEGAMSKVTKIYKGDSTSILVCDDCSGIWLDRGQFDKIKKIRNEQEDEQKKKRDEGGEWFPIYWWLFYPHICATGALSVQAFKFGGGESGGAGKSGGYDSSPSCVSCACVAACACACACAGSGAAGCSPKNKLSQIDIEKIGGIKWQKNNHSF